MKRRLHRPVRSGVVRALQDIFSAGHPADKVIQRHLKTNKKWGSQDRRLFAECVYDVVRWWRRLHFAALSPWPPAEANFDGVVAAWCALNEVETEGEVDQRALRTRYEEKGLSRSVRESIPDWLDTWGAAELGVKWDQILPVLNTIAPVYLRANGLKTSAEELRRALRTEDIECDVAGGDALKLVKRANVFLTKAFHQGLFEVQDLSSQAVALALDPKPGERVIDACAGAGGKSLHIAALMGNRGKVIAMDVHERKLGELRERSNRAGATSIETRLIEGTKTIKRLHESADRVLLDVPCSGLGVLRRNPDSKWKLSPEDVDRVRTLQGEILFNYSTMVKPGGRLVYSTCSIMPSENAKQVEKFLSETGGAWRRVEEETLWPEVQGPDGFYVAVLERVSR